MSAINLTAGGSARVTEANPLGLTDYPFTIATWLKRPAELSTDAPWTFAGFGSSVSAVPRHTLSTSSIAHYIVYNRCSAEISTGNAGKLTTADGWAPMVGVFTSATSRTCYLESHLTSDTDNRDAGCFDTGTDGIASASGRFAIGERPEGAQQFAGLMAHVAVWSVSLSAADIEAYMTTKTNPLDIDATNLLAYYDGTTRVDGADTYLVDQTANANDLLISGTVTIDTEDDPGVADPLSTNGVRITGIKEPNEADTLVTSVTNARVKAWTDTIAADDELAPSQVLTNQSITAGELEVELTANVDDSVILSVDWGAGSGETKFFRTTGTVIDLDAT